MSMHFFREMENIKNEILALGAMVEGDLHKAVTAIVKRDAELAAEVIAKDAEIDAKEVELEEELLKILALNQPVAVDLRFLIATLKINNDLERIGDLSVNIAKRARLLCGKAVHPLPIDLAAMSDAVEAMVNKSIDALVNMDARAASEVCEADDSVDDIKRNNVRVITKHLTTESDPDAVEVLVALLLACRELERIGDHATNIAEDIIYMTDGAIVRHHAHELPELG